MGEERQSKTVWREPPVSVGAAVAFNLALAAAQLALFLPDVIVGRATDAAVYRVDGLALFFGVAWCLAAALAAWGLPGREFRGWPALTICLMTVAALNMAYAREPLRLLVAWELMGLSVWLIARLLSGRGLRWLAAALHLPGWAFLAAILLGLVPPFAPPFGGEGEAWPAWVAVILGVIALIRSGSWPFNAWASLTLQATGGLIRPLLALYALAAPFVLAKALVAAPWEPLGGWALALLGTASLLGSTWVRVAIANGAGVPLIAPVYAAAAVVGFGLGSVSPLAASGALALLLAGMLSLPLLDVGKLSRLAALGGALAGVWLISQGALASGYAVVAALLLPAVALTSLWGHRGSDEAGRRTRSRAAMLSAAFTLLVAIYPQALVGSAVRPAVGAMAGGVAAPNELTLDWGLGLRIEGAQGILLAALPAVGIVVALFLAWTALYLLRRVVVRSTDGSTSELSGG